MVTNAADYLLEEIQKKENPSVVGLDPIISRIPSFLINEETKNNEGFEAVRNIIIRFNKLIIDAVCDIVPAVKPQMAYYEQYGSYGVNAFEETVTYAKQKGLVVIEDAKRNDIGSTAKAYSNGHLGKVKLGNDQDNPGFDVDFLTVTPYLGSDGINPFIDDCKDYGKGIFVLVKTSNPSSGELQDITVYENKKVYEIMAEQVDRLGKELIGKKGYSSFGAVVGATYPNEAKKLRGIMRHSIFLVPGYGEQGGTANDIVPCFNDDGYGAIVNSARGIIYAYEKEPYCSIYKPEEFHLAARAAAINMRNDIRQAIKASDKKM